MTKTLKLEVHANGEVAVLIRPTEAFVTSIKGDQGVTYRLDHILLNKTHGRLVTSWILQTKSGRDWKRGGDVTKWESDLPEALAAQIWDAVAPALRAAFEVEETQPELVWDVMTNSWMTREEWHAQHNAKRTEVPAGEQPGYGVHYIQAERVQQRWFQTAQGREWWIDQKGSWIKVLERVDPKERKRLSDKTLDDFGGSLSTRDNSGLHWMVQSELAHELSQLASTLDVDRARKLIAAVCSGLPISLTWDTPFGEDRVERRTTVVLVERLSAPHPTNDALPGRVRVHYWGFTHDVWMDRIVDVDTPGTTSVYLDR